VLGGLARRVELVEKISSKGNPHLVVDSGDLFFERKGAADPQKNLAKAEILAKAYRKMGVAAVNVGDLDLLAGVDFLQKKAGEGLPLISANLAEASTGKLLFKAYRVVEAGSFKIGFVGLMGPELDPQVRKAAGEKVSLLDPWEAAKKTLEELRGKADVVVVLSDMGMARDQRLAKEVEGIQFILGGHDGRFVSSAEQQGGSWLLQSYSKGMYVGSLRLRLEEPGRPIWDEGRASRLEQELAKLEGRIDAHRKAQQRGPNPSVERSLKQLEEQRIRLKQELEEARNKRDKGNRFSWRLEPLDPSLPEDQEVTRWIQEAGIQAD
jgi:5'-nucleotidase/UDP-sugar diphosphatase